MTNAAVNSGKDVVLRSYLIMFPKPQDVIRQLEINAFLSQVFPWTNTKDKLQLLVQLLCPLN